MPPALLLSRMAPSTAGETAWTPLASQAGRREGGSGGGVEADAVAVFRSTVTLSRLYLFVSNNTADGDHTWTVKRNGVLTALSVTIGAGLTGAFWNATDSVTFNPGDTGVLEYTQGGTLGQIDVTTGECVVAMICTAPGGDTVTILNAVGGPHSVAGTTRYVGLTDFGQWNTVQADHQYRVDLDCTVRLAQCWVETNTRPDPTSVVLQVDGVDTGMSLAIGGGVTGRLEEAAPVEVSVTAGQLVGWRCTLGPGVGALELSQVRCELVSAAREFPLFVTGSFNGYTIAGGAGPLFFMLGGMMLCNDASEDGHSPAFACSLSRLSAYVRANTLANPTQTAFRLDAVSPGPSVTHGAGVTGWQTDLASPAVPVLETSSVGYRWDVGAGAGSIVFQVVGLVGQTFAVEGYRDYLAAPAGGARLGIPAIGRPGLRVGRV